MPELVDIRDEAGRPTGETMARHEAHETEARHGIALVWLYNSKGEILLQKRAAHLNAFAELWDVTVSGHLMAGEKQLEAAVRELAEEIGVYADAGELREAGMVIDSYPLAYGKTHMDCDFVFLSQQDIGLGELRLQAAEVYDARWINAEELARALDDPNSSRQYAARDRQVYQYAIEAARKAGV